jgi:hypothetical protein
MVNASGFSSQLLNEKMIKNRLQFNNVFEEILNCSILISNQEKPTLYEEVHGYLC